LAGGQGDAEAGAFAGLALNVDASVVGPHELADDGQADTGAAGLAGARVLAAPEALEDVGEVLAVDAGTAVGDVDDGLVVALTYFSE
jgi:hypothetical protein